MFRQRLAITMLLGGLVACGDDTVELLTAADLADFERPAADRTIGYGDGPLQFGELRIPTGAGPHPVAIFIHGGCWLSEYDIDHSSELTAALTRHGIATWSLEYRRVGDAGGGWPGTFQDIGRGVDHLGSIAAEHNLDLDKVILMGHSAGGQLALWAAARSRMPADSPLYSSQPLAVRGVVALAPAADLGFLHEEEVCGHVVDRLMGGSPAEVPDRYQWGDPAQLDPLPVPQLLIIGSYDAAWAPAGRRYFAAADQRGDDVRLLEATQSGHFEMIDPDSSTWPVVLDAVRSMAGTAAP